MAVVHPALGEERATAQALLNMAERARDVKVTTNTAPNTGYVAFEVPDELADRWATAQAAAVKEIEDMVAKAAEEEEVRPRRGRPRKATKAAAEKAEAEKADESTEDEDPSDEEDTKE